MYLIVKKDFEYLVDIKDPILVSIHNDILSQETP